MKKSSLAESAKAGPAVQITFRNLDPSSVIEGTIREEAAKLSLFYPLIMGCHVAVGVPHRHHRRGATYHVRIEITVPGGDIVVKREPGLAAPARQMRQGRIQKRLERTTPHKDLSLAIRDAFQIAGRRLQDYARRQRGDVKMHNPLEMGSVTRILPDESYGFLTSKDGRQIYFHKNSVLKGQFSRLKEGTVVSFVEEEGEKGPQASTVRVVSPVPKIHAQTGVAVHTG
jgi:cold shock CspA family protein